MPEAAVSRMAPGREELAAGSILIIDDEPVIRESLQTLLELEGYEVETAGDGRRRAGADRREAVRPGAARLCAAGAQRN